VTAVIDELLDVLLELEDEELLEELVLDDVLVLLDVLVLDDDEDVLDDDEVLDELLVDELLDDELDVVLVELVLVVVVVPGTNGQQRPSLRKSIPTLKPMKCPRRLLRPPRLILPSGPRLHASSV